MILEKCCFCLDLRKGAIVIATFHMVLALGQIFTMLRIVYTAIGVMIFGLIAGAVLLYGAIKYNTVAIIIHMVLALIEIVFLLATAILIFVSVAAWNLNGRELHWLHTLSLVIGGVISLWAIIEIYFLVCVCSFYQQLKSGMITSPA